MTSATVQASAVSTCPRWCGGDHVVCRDVRLHAADHGVGHRSAPIDQWVGQHSHGRVPITVHISGFRHDHPEGPGNAADWPDAVTVDGDGSLDFRHGLSLPAADARRLGRALLAAADLIEDQ